MMDDNSFFWNKQHLRVCSGLPTSQPVWAKQLTALVYVRDTNTVITVSLRVFTMVL